MNSDTTISIPRDVLRALAEAAYWPVWLERYVDQNPKSDYSEMRREYSALKGWLFECMKVAEVLSRGRSGSATPEAFVESLGWSLDQMQGLTADAAKIQREVILAAYRKGSYVGPWTTNRAKCSA